MVSTLYLTSHHHSIIHMQFLIISSQKSLSDTYPEASIAICIVSWGECIVAALLFGQPADYPQPKVIYIPSKIWLESIGINGIENGFAIHNIWSRGITL